LGARWGPHSRKRGSIDLLRLCQSPPVTFFSRVCVCVCVRARSHTHTHTRTRTRTHTHICSAVNATGQGPKAHTYICMSSECDRARAHRDDIEVANQAGDKGSRHGFDGSCRSLQGVRHQIHHLPTVAQWQCTRYLSLPSIHIIYISYYPYYIYI
jgi:hypothetical protein